MKFLSQFFIKIDKKNVSADFMDDVIEIVVENSLYLPEMFTILLEDSQLKWVDSDILGLGKAVEISAQAAEAAGGSKGMLIEGEITALEPDFSAKGAVTLLIRGYNKSHRLHRGRKSRTFLRSTDSDLVKKIAAEVGMSAEVDATSVVHNYILQNNQTNMEFLAGRAERLGYQVFAVGSKLYFKKGGASLGKGPELVFGDTLQSFHPVLAATHQVDKVIVMGWDAGRKEAIKGQATPSLLQGGVKKTGGQEAKSAFQAAETVLVNHPVASVDEANALAKGLAYDIGSEFIQAEGICLGNPKVKAGYTITVKGLGQRFSGDYFVTSATHILNEHGYETHFTISGRQPNTVHHLLESRTGFTGDRGVMPGLAIGVVTNIKSTEKDWGQVKVKYPWLGNDIESDWIRVSAPGAGAMRGIYWLPEINDEVLLGFEHGNIHHPYIIGGLWNGKDKPPVAVEKAVGRDGKVDQRVIRSRSGHQVLFIDTHNEEQILIRSKSGHEMRLDDASGKEKFILKDKSGSNQIIFDSTQHTVTIDAGQNLVLKCGQKLTLDCTELEVTAKSKGVIKANTSLSLESLNTSTLKGAQVSLNGSAQTEVKGGAMVQIQGGMVKIN